MILFSTHPLYQVSKTLGKRILAGGSTRPRRCGQGNFPELSGETATEWQEALGIRRRILEDYLRLLSLSGSVSIVLVSGFHIGRPGS
jgi:hypothetical protein